MTSRFRRTRQVAVRAGFVAALLVVIGLTAFLPFAGRFLVVQDPLERSDAIVVLAGARVERWLEAVDLYREGWAPRILLSAGRLENAEVRLRASGINFPSEAELTRDAMIQMKIPPESVTIMPQVLDNTAQEAAATHAIAFGRGWTRVIVVTSKYHTRRTQFAIRRELRGTPVQAIVRWTRYDESTPERWWRRRADVRFVIIETQRLLLYRLGLGG
ncbi:MAG: YdcF family protein [Acidobacteriota bacterium]